MSFLLRTCRLGRAEDETVLADVAVAGAPDGKNGASYTWGCCCGHVAAADVAGGAGYA